MCSGVIGCALPRQLQQHSRLHCVEALWRGMRHYMPQQRCLQQRRGAAAAAASMAAEDQDTRRLNIYTDYTIYKSKGAMSLKVIRPSWERTATGSGLRISRAGSVLLEFANSRGEREYDWDDKGLFSISAGECGDVLEALEGRGERQFFHDPSKGGADEGSIQKTLRVSPARDTGHFFSLVVNAKLQNRAVNYNVAVSPAELRVIRTLLNFAIPRMLGFDEIFAGTPDVRGDAPF